MNTVFGHPYTAHNHLISKINFSTNVKKHHKADTDQVLDHVLKCYTDAVDWVLVATLRQNGANKMNICFLSYKEGRP
jgi:hypothetical protein